MYRTLALWVFHCNQHRLQLFARCFCSRFSFSLLILYICLNYSYLHALHSMVVQDVAKRLEQAKLYCVWISCKHYPLISSLYAVFSYSDSFRWDKVTLGKLAKERLAAWKLLCVFHSMTAGLGKQFCDVTRSCYVYLVHQPPSSTSLDTCLLLSSILNTSFVLTSRSLNFFSLQLL